MPHVTFIHGIANKLEKEKQHATWLRELNHDGMFDLHARGVTTSFVYWADVLYEQPLDEAQAQESVGHEHTDGETVTTANDEDLAWIEDLPDDEQAAVEKLRKRLNFDVEPPSGDDAHMQDPYSAAVPDELESTDFERIPLPWFVKRRVMKILLRDVHHYLFNTEHEPRAGERFKVKDEIQRRFVETITQDAQQNTNNGPHVVVSHSMGTVISYDCLKHRIDCPQVNALMTIGSPLGLDEIQDMMPAWSREDGFPGSHVTTSWTNVYDRLDPVAGFDANLANDYKKNHQSVVNDIKVSNTGRWRHSSWKYFQQESLRDALKEQLDL